MCRRRVKICRKRCAESDSRYPVYVPMVGLFRKPGRDRSACVGHHTSSQLRGEDSNPGTRKKACVSHENFVRDRVYREGMGSIMGTYLV